eukprot:CAMPEP_0119570900 /NCGR_PEP_ID=MMETSP1352-20130426/43848_1 /TAXON_ID=265584 /ORGANISM="Stauroneis constricta, Strain CCMP1120" /LENGTH=168 /DNA_ID=CAMNT_0007620577 /DNA_START=347 /DNA_END=853 /DNA_ORIENTATION=-
MALGIRHDIGILLALDRESIEMHQMLRDVLASAMIVRLRGGMEIGIVMRFVQVFHDKIIFILFCVPACQFDCVLMNDHVLCVDAPHLCYRFCLLFSRVLAAATAAADMLVVDASRCFGKRHDRTSSGWHGNRYRHEIRTSFPDGWPSKAVVRSFKHRSIDQRKMNVED